MNNSPNPGMPRTVRILKKTAIIIGISLAALAVLSALLFAIYRTRLQQAILHEINKHLTAEVQTGMINISLLAHFPMVSVKMKDIRIKDTQYRRYDSDLVQKGDLSLHFNLLDILHKKYTLQSVKISHARINMMVFEDGSDNYHIWKQSADTGQGSFSVELREVILQMVDITWQNPVIGDVYAFMAEDAGMKGNFTEKRFDLHIKGDFFVSQVQSRHRVYLKDKDLIADLQISINNQDRTYMLHEGKVRSGLIALQIQGVMHGGPEGTTEIAASAASAPLGEYLALIPPGYFSLPESVDAAGTVSATMTIKKKSAGDAPVELLLGFEMDNGTIAFTGPQITMKEVQLTGTYAIQPAEGDLTRDELTLNTLKASLGDGTIGASLKITGLSHPMVFLDADMDLRLQDLVTLWPDDTFRELAGQVRMNVHLKGPLRSLSEAGLEDLLACDIRGEMSLRMDQLSLNNSNWQYHDLQADILFDDKHLDVRSMTGKIGNGDFQIKGIFLNFLPWLMTENEPLRMDADLVSNRIDLGEMLRTGPERTGDDNPFRLPPNIILNLDITVNELACNSFSATDLSTNLTLFDQILTFDDLRFTSMEGSVSGDCSLQSAPAGSYKLSCNARLKHVNISQLFHDMDNFGQTGLTDEHLQGFMDADVFFSSGLSPFLAIDPKNVYALGSIRIGSGELIGYSPLYSLSGFLNIDDLKHIRFSELKNLVEIRNQTIIIPEMEIKSSTLDLNLYGTHTFNNEIDYHLNLLLSQLLSAKFRSRSQDEFGVVQDDGLGRTKLYISLFGKADGPKISYDRIALKEKLSGDLQKERMEIRQALHKEFSDTGNTDPSRGKIKGPRFRIEWEDTDTIPDPRKP